jgi:hypothetical protein
MYLALFSHIQQNYWLRYPRVSLGVRKTEKLSNVYKTLS